MPKKAISLDNLAEPYRSQAIAQMQSTRKTQALPGADLKTYSGALAAPKKRRGMMNGTETQWFKILQDRGYHKIQFESVKLKLADGAWYCPDFYCSSESEYDGVTQKRVTIYEVKNNFIREASLVRLKVAAHLYPEFCFILAQKKNGQWIEKTLSK